MTPEKQNEFAQEYNALCAKYGMVITPTIALKFEEYILPEVAAPEVVEEASPEASIEALDVPEVVEVIEV